MQTRHLITSRLAAGALACAGAFFTLSAQAQGSFFAVVPVSGVSAVGQLRPVKIALAGAVPPAATMGVQYEFNLGTLLSLDGPEGTEPGKVTWGVAAGDLPAGLSLVGDRVVGAPTELASNRQVTILAEYPSSQGTVGAMASYSFAVTGVAITEQDGYRAWADGTIAASCEAYIRPKDPIHQYVGATGDGVYRILLSGRPMDVYCDQTIDSGGWVLLMKQASGDGATLQGDTTYWKNGTVLNDTVVGRSMADGNFVSAAFAVLPVMKFHLQAANESSLGNHDNPVAMTGLTAFSDARRTDYMDMGGVWAPSAPSWFIHATTYPNGGQIVSARFGFNFREIGQPPTMNQFSCGARWGWAANNDTSPDLAGTADACGGLGAWGSQYGREYMNNNKGAWQPATLYLWGR
ncbi:fibrinogen-like YCDxxxxGGGW domain-containing protein [Castellaniella sp.]|uniref:fibrinogen-like YCDxxxxGGGW domain-containing protein n=1 Tax=Castellaniella sp. TaxID=1955812 RepID=UPI003C738028